MRNPLVYHSVRFLGSFLLKRVMPYFSVGIVLSHSTNTFRERTLLCCVSKTFRWRKNLWTRGREEVSKFTTEYFLSHCAKKIVIERFCVPQNCWYRNYQWIRQGSGCRAYYDFLSQIVVSECRKLL